MRLKVLAAAFLVLTVFLPAQQKSELRGVWLTNVDSYVLTTDKSISDAMDYLASIGINVVFPVVYNKGYTLYPSAVMDSLFDAPTIPDNSFRNRDFLDRLTIEAHRNGIEVIPWFEFGFSSSYSLNGGHIIKKFPHWALKNSSGQLVVKNGFDWLSGIHPEVQNYMLSLITEILDNYDVDGVQGDDRLPAMPAEGGYEPYTAELYKAEHNGQNPPASYTDASWVKWRADKLTQYLGRMRDSVKTRDTNLILSVSPTPHYWGYNQYLQDSKSWAQQKLTDNIIPQLYQYNISDYNYALNTTWNLVGQYHPQAFTAGVLSKVGSYVVSPSLLTQMLQANRAKGISGECFFFYEALRANSSQLGTLLKENFYSQPALLPYRNNNVWRPKALIVNEDASDAVKTGNWEVYQSQGFNGPIFRTADTLTYTALSYYFDVEAEAYYDVFIYKVPNFGWTKNAPYSIHSLTGDSAVSVDQSNLNEKGWYKIGTARLSPGMQKVLTLDNSRLEPGKYLSADAAMIMINRRLSPGVIVSVENSHQMPSPPEEFKLSQNYPNPFNPVTTIRFTVPEAGLISLKVYDILGREAAVIFNEYKSAGSYSAEFDASLLASGVYFYELKSASASVSRKMILLK